MALGEERQQLDDRRKQALQKGGPEHMAARAKKGALTARERVLGVLDPGTFVELDLFVDGVVAGHGSVAGRQVYIFSQGWMDDTWRGRAGEEHDPVRIGEGAAEKIVKVIDLALMSGAPLIGIYDGDLGSRGSAGRGWTDIFFHNVMASGLIPQISAVMGPCLGGAAYLPAVTDLVIMVKGSSQLSAAGSAVAVSEGIGEGATPANLATGRRAEAEAAG
ncbi:MAG: hypothetical protein M1274_07000, partial [Actinobacteria bacterium]|nr:hypothetical protein [Actinomycetota bacterium]